MIDRILQHCRVSDYDFRLIANPADQLAHLFPDWVSYYRMKGAIAQALQPKTILEIGVRYGYSGAAFLHGCPAAHYTGIDLDADSFGGTKGAIDWARRILPAGQHELIVANTQSMTRLPGGIYDLIHVDGQQDGDGTFHDLEMAIRQGRHVLVDGYLWTAQNFRAASEFLLQHKESIDYYVVIPSYAGELLIKVREAALLPPLHSSAGVESGAIRKSYTASYYLRDCGGWDSFGQSRGRELRDARLRSVFDLTMMHQPRRVLDLGCGRGEIAYQAAAQNCEVVALDYSPDAIEIARSSLADAPAEIRDRITLLCEDATKINLPQPVDVALAGDLIEHMAPAELDKLYAAVARQLTPAGMFVIHTFPNKWYYDYDYPRRRRIAASVGAYLPPNPRSRYERLMHINEQSPRVLRRQLQKHFPHVLLWFGSPEDPASSLQRRHSPRELAAQRDLFVLASPVPINQAEVQRLFAHSFLSQDDVAAVRLESTQKNLRLPAGACAHLDVVLRNDSPHALSSTRPRPVYFAYHWLRASSREMVVFDGQRSPLVPTLPPASSRRYTPSFLTPADSGDYLLQMSLVQEGVRWFDSTNPHALIEVEVQVR